MLASYYTYLLYLLYPAIEALRTWKFWYLAPVYGEQTDGIAVALIMCLTTTVVLIVTTATGHGILVRAGVLVRVTLKPHSQVPSPLGTRLRST